MSQESENSLEKLNQNLHAHNGEAVLVVTRYWDQCGWDMPEKDTPYAFAQSLCLGVATEPFLEQRRGIIGDLLVCSPQYVELEGEKVKVNEGPIRGWRIATYYLDKPLGPKKTNQNLFWSFPSPEDDDMREKSLALEVLAGDQKVTEWFIQEARYGQLRACERLLIERYQDQINPDYQKLLESRLDTNILVGYTRMRAALGLPAAVLPIDLEARVLAAIQQRKSEMVTNIEKLLKMDADLSQRLAVLQKLQLPRIGFSLEGRDYEEAVLEDEVELRFIKSIPLTKNQRDIQDRLQATVKKAVNWGLHQEDWVISEEIRPGKKIETDIPVLIKGLAQYFEVPLAKAK